MSKIKGQTDMDRRAFLGKTAGVATAAVVAPGVFLHTVADAKDQEQAVTDKVRWGMLIDTNKCADGCNDCVSACTKENGLPSHDRPTTDPKWIRKVKVRDNLTGMETRPAATPALVI